ncbi:glycosyltransferase [Aliigemmobacter aestuarii]|uniref:Glycosyltransferase n=2 Tax=Aliigemmobacter aestuarii TaxID=1445661 RepID=A0A4S3MKV5_9RHOB|nr:glycosyltransferase [Gemmobacter aestuarii]
MRDAAPSGLPSTHTPAPHGGDQALARTLLNDEGLPADRVLPLLETARSTGQPLADLVLAAQAVPEAALARAHARLTGWTVIDPTMDRPDARLIDRIGAARCLADGVLPWRSIGGVTFVAVAHPRRFDTLLPMLEAGLGPVRPLLATEGDIERALLALRGKALDRAARTSVAPAESCRDWGGLRLWSVLTGLAAALLASLILFPLALLWLATAWAIATLALATMLRAAAAFAALRRQPPDPPPPAIARLPVVSVMVALYHEADIAPRLVRRLGRIDYPSDLLDILLVVEEDDHVTRAALRRAQLPATMRVIVVPDGGLKTKPRALNHALAACRGSLVGIYDAEDAPAPDQITRVVERFHARPERVACLQGVLDFYNPHTNWLSRCFTIDYAMWFRIILPGMERLGLAIPLGGTTVFFRRHILEQLGAWDAHNVTEDADLGMRLARHGYRTEVIASTTMEEANCRTIPWIRQRSRWLKGYMMTYAVHMRRPRQLLHQLGWRKFLGFQIFFATTLSQFLLAPVLWSFWAVPLGLPHPVAGQLPPALQLATFTVFLSTEAVLLAVGVMALRLTPNRINPLWVPMLHLYFPLGALASYKAAWELVTRPFWWDKTHHGLFDPAEPAPPGQT